MGCKLTNLFYTSLLCYSFDMKVRYFILVFLLILIFPPRVSAKFITVNGSGEIEYSVLAATDGGEEMMLEIPKSDQLEVKELAKQKPSSAGVISLSKNNDKISMSVDYGDSKKEFDFSEYSDAILEIEERPQTQSLQIRLRENKFSLEQKGVVALTDFPINVDSKSAKITVTTERGDRIVSVLPYGAVEALLRAKVISIVNENKVKLEEKDSELAYQVDGAKILNLLDFYAYSVPITAYVSASTGEVLKVEAPIWFKFVDFIFS